MPPLPPQHPKSPHLEPPHPNRPSRSAPPTPHRPSLNPPSNAPPPPLPPQGASGQQLVWGGNWRPDSRGRPPGGGFRPTPGALGLLLGDHLVTMGVRIKPWGEVSQNGGLEGEQITRVTLQGALPKAIEVRPLLTGRRTEPVQ